MSGKEVMVRMRRGEAEPRVRVLDFQGREPDGWSSWEWRQDRQSIELYQQLLSSEPWKSD